MTDSPPQTQPEPPPPIQGSPIQQLTDEDNNAGVECIARLGQLSHEMSAGEQSSSSSTSSSSISLLLPQRNLQPQHPRRRLFRDSSTAVMVPAKRHHSSSSSVTSHSSAIHKPFLQAPQPPQKTIATEAQKQMRANFMARITRISSKLKRPIPVLPDAPLPDVEAVFLSLNAEQIERRQIAEYIRVATYTATVVEGLFRWLSRSFKPFADWDMSGLALNFRNDLEDNEDLLYAVYDKYGQYWKPNPLVSVALVLACCARDTNAKNAEQKLQHAVKQTTMGQSSSTHTTGGDHQPQQQAINRVRSSPQPQQTELDKTIADLERDMKRLTLTPQTLPDPVFSGAQVSPVVHRGDDGQVKRGLTLLPLQ